jgi:hypothetical protein
MHSFGELHREGAAPLTHLPFTRSKSNTRYSGEVDAVMFVKASVFCRDHRVANALGNFCKRDWLSVDIFSRIENVVIGGKNSARLNAHRA